MRRKNKGIRALFRAAKLAPPLRHLQYSHPSSGRPQLLRHSAVTAGQILVLVGGRVREQRGSCSGEQGCESHGMRVPHRPCENMSQFPEFSMIAWLLCPLLHQRRVGVRRAAPLEWAASRPSSCRLPRSPGSPAPRSSLCASTRPLALRERCAGSAGPSLYMSDSRALPSLSSPPRPMRARVLLLL